MTLRERKTFYLNDKRDYKVKLNKDFLLWYNEALDTGYYSHLDLDGIQDLIDFITRWYEIKYPDRDLETGVKNNRFSNIDDLSSLMDVEQLRYRLSDNKLGVFDCKYRSNGGYSIAITSEDKISFIDYNVISVKKLDDDTNINISITEDGLVKEEDLNILGITKNVCNINELYDLMKSTNSFELDNLECCIETHKYDLELRNNIINLVSLSLLYSKNTSPDLALKRVHKFIDEINEYFNGNVNIGSEEIDILYEHSTTPIVAQHKVLTDNFQILSDDVFIDLKNTNHKHCSNFKRKVKSIFKI